MIKTPCKKKKGSGRKRRMTETQGNSRSMSRLLITGLITSRCLVSFKGRERREKGREEQRKKREKKDINACGVRKKGRSRKSDTKREGFGAPRNKLTLVGVAVSRSS